MNRGENYGVCPQSRVFPQKGTISVRITNVFDVRTIKAVDGSEDSVSVRLNKEFNNLVKKNLINNEHLPVGQLVAFENDEKNWCRAWIRQEASRTNQI